ncbi:hypothetical protein GQ42DRAFT_169389 [Ramicandelaber brevisporus]|nr:hypothetical protein GQ42DRAFT_153572 [Ramicandelaber brevisporus]KAI8873679.1 hypothetical protein GQ42DRAFT_169389 [Ramicandelaber brevisporus]
MTAEMTVEETSKSPNSNSNSNSSSSSIPVVTLVAGAAVASGLTYCEEIAEFVQTHLPQLVSQAQPYIDQVKSFDYNELEMPPLNMKTFLTGFLALMIPGLFILMIGFQRINKTPMLDNIFMVIPFCIMCYIWVIDLQNMGTATDSYMNDQMMVCTNANVAALAVTRADYEWSYKNMALLCYIGALYSQISAAHGNVLHFWATIPVIAVIYYVM